ncbi:OLC1v1007245C1 [Oldenlandia corymbosa var. corymbosa]|uniref:OLC1v1007245C1 n=1 Tax=Oldenlandia corymbosa var. corymbosa TaxID=529605 RepID=A0AAV1DJ91_OLDCO|nr:OLC1v1007245C1 [Oldenlandia corymbosa var. corymbosa]
MAKQFVAVLILCIVVAATVQIEKTQAEGVEEKFKECYDNCHKSCFNQNGNGYTFCEMKCDADCGEKQIKASLDELHN